MISFKKRLRRSSFISVLLALLFVIVMLSKSYSLENIGYFSGWTLLILVLALSAYNVRKKLTYPPLFKSSTWLQFHSYMGALSILVFFLHTGGRLPGGQLDVIIYVLFVLLAGSGVLGLYLSRAIPKRLTDRGTEVLFERIPIFVRQLREQAEALMVESVEHNDVTILADFYRRSLLDFMAGPRNIGWHLIQSNRSRNRLQHSLKAIHRYLSDDEAATANKLSQLIDQKNDLDFHYAQQGILKIWLFAHIPLTFVLLMFAFLHLILVHAFSGAAL